MKNVVEHGKQKNEGSQLIKHKKWNWQPKQIEQIATTLFEEGQFSGIKDKQHSANRFWGLEGLEDQKEALLFT